MRDLSPSKVWPRRLRDHEVLPPKRTGESDARYYMHLRDGTEELLDADGREFASLAALRDAVLFTARDCLVNDVRDGVLDLRFRIDVEDDGGAIVYSLPFKHAINIIPEGAGSPDVGVA